MRLDGRGALFFGALACEGCRARSACGSALFGFTSALCRLTLWGDFAYSLGCCPATCTRRLLPLWKLLWQYLQRARSNFFGVAVDVGEHLTWRRCSFTPFLVKSRLQYGHCEVFGDVFPICCHQQIRAMPIRQWLAQRNHAVVGVGIPCIIALARP